MGTGAGPTAVALIPARSGSKRVKDKNIRRLAGHPLIAYAIAAARESGIFQAIVASTDSEEIAAVARRYGAEVPFLRPESLAGDHAPDILWVEFTLRELGRTGRSFDCFSIVRPTNPFRVGATIRRAWDAFLAEEGADSLRAVERCAQHPGKMWVPRGKRLLPLLPFATPTAPWHSTPTQALPEVYIQNASLEIAWTRVALEGRTIAGEAVVPFFTQGAEGLDINRPEDFERAELLVARGEALLPPVSVEEPAARGARS